MNIDAQSHEAPRNEVADVLGAFTVPYLQRLYRTFDGDLLLPLVLGEIAQHNLARSQEQSAAFATPASTVVGDDARRKRYMRPCNTLAISALTGVPRETVRRKVELLVKGGLIERNERGHLSVTPVAAERFASIERETVQGILAAGDRLRILAEAAPAAPGQ